MAHYYKPLDDLMPYFVKDTAFISWRAISRKDSSRTDMRTWFVTLKGTVLDSHAAWHAKSLRKLASHWGPQQVRRFGISSPSELHKKR
jgi:hypothetical protein